MKALIISNITKRFQPGHFSMITPLEELGFDVHWTANFNEYKDDIKKAPIKTHHIDFYRNPFNPKNIIAFKQLVSLLKKEQFDLIHCNSPIGGILGRLCGNFTKAKKIIYTVHGFHFYKGAPFINRTLFKCVEMLLARYTDALITINHEDFQTAKNLKLRNSGDIYYIPGVGVDTSLIRNAESKRQELLQEVKADTNSILIISVGELNNNKNNKVVIEALGKLQNSNIHYLLCGVGDKKAELLSLSKKYKIDENVHFLDYRKDIPQLLKSCDIFVMPSFREGLSRSIMEAMSAGLPCVVSNIRGNVDLVEEGKGGYLCHPDDVDGFAEAINSLAIGTKLRETMGFYNLEEIMRFDIENVKQEMLTIYERELS